MKDMLDSNSQRLLEAMTDVVQQSVQQSEQRMTDRMTDIEARMATKDDIKNMATKDDIKDMATKDDIKNMATKDDLDAMASKFDLQQMERRLSRKISSSHTANVQHHLETRRDIGDLSRRIDSNSGNEYTSGW